MSKTRLEPMGDHALVVDQPNVAMVGGIELPGNVRQQEMCFGFVVSVGPSCLVLKPQDRVCYGPYAGKSILLDGCEFRLLREGQIEGRLVDTE